MQSNAIISYSIYCHCKCCWVKHRLSSCIDSVDQIQQFRSISARTRKWIKYFSNKWVNRSILVKIFLRLHEFYVHVLWNRVWLADSVSPSNRISDMQQDFCIAAIHFDSERCACRWVCARNGHSRESVRWCEHFPFFHCHFHQLCKCIGSHFDPVSCDKPNLRYHIWFGVCRFREKWEKVGVKYEWIGRACNNNFRGVLFDTASCKYTHMCGGNLK